MALRIFYRQTLLAVFLLCSRTFISSSSVQSTAVHLAKKYSLEVLTGIASFNTGSLRERISAETLPRSLGEEESRNAVIETTTSNNETLAVGEDKTVSGGNAGNDTSGESDKVNEPFKEVAVSPSGGEQTKGETSTTSEKPENSPEAPAETFGEESATSDSVRENVTVVGGNPASGSEEADPSGSSGQPGQASDPSLEGEKDSLAESMNGTEQLESISSGEPSDGGSAGGNQPVPGQETENPCKDITNCEACQKASSSITSEAEVCFWNSNIKKCRKVAKAEKANLENMCVLPKEEVATDIAGGEKQGNESTVNDDTSKNEFLCGNGSECATRCKSSINAIEKCFGTKGGNDEAVFRQCVNCILVKEAASQLDAGTISGQNYTDQVCENQSSCEKTCGICFPEAIEITSCAWNCEPPEILASNDTLIFSKISTDEDSAKNQAVCGEGSECAIRCEDVISAFEDCFEIIGGNDTVVFRQCVNCLRAQELVDQLESGIISVLNYTEAVCRNYSKCESTCGVCFPEVVGIASCAWNCEPPEKATSRPPLSDESAITASPSIPPSEDPGNEGDIFDRPELNNSTTVSENGTILVSLLGLKEILDNPQKNAFQNATQTFFRDQGDGTVTVKILRQHLVYRSRNLKERSLQIRGVGLTTLVRSSMDGTPGLTAITTIENNEKDYLDTLISQDEAFFGAIEGVQVGDPQQMETLSDTSVGDESSKEDASPKEKNKILLFSLPLVAIIFMTLAATLFLAWKIRKAISVQEKILSVAYEGDGFSCKSRESDAFDCEYSGDGEIRDECTSRKGRRDRKNTDASDDEDPYLADRQMSLQRVVQTHELTSEDDTRGFRSEESDDYISEEDSYQFAATSSIEIATDDSSGEPSSNEAKHRRGNGLVPDGFFDEENSRQDEIKLSQPGPGNNDEDSQLQEKPFSYDDALKDEHEINGGVFA